MSRRVLAAALAVLIVWTLGGCASDAGQEAAPSEEPKTNVTVDKPAARTEAQPSDAEYDALRGRLQDSVPVVQAAADKAINESNFTPMYDAATAFLEIGHGMVRKIEDTPELDPQGKDLALVIAIYDVISTTIGETQDEAAEGRLIYLDNYPDGQEAAEYERWLTLNGYR